VVDSGQELPPIVTAGVKPKFVPTIVIKVEVPPVGPVSGVTEVMVGALKENLVAMEALV